MIAADTSVAVAGFASWHEAHEPARAALTRRPRLVDHCALEVYSVLTRLPAPHRADPALVAEFLARQFPDEYLTIGAGERRTLVGRLAELRITGGAACDALIAATAQASGATLVSLDWRATETYRRLGASVEMLA